MGRRTKEDLWLGEDRTVNPEHTTCYEKNLHWYFQASYCKPCVALYSAQLGLITLCITPLVPPCPWPSIPPWGCGKEFAQVRGEQSLGLGRTLAFVCTAYGTHPSSLLSPEQKNSQLIKGNFQMLSVQGYCCAWCCSMEGHTNGTWKPPPGFCRGSRAGGHWGTVQLCQRGHPWHLHQIHCFRDVLAEDTHQFTCDTK